MYEASTVHRLQHQLDAWTRVCDATWQQDAARAAATAGEVCLAPARLLTARSAEVDLLDVRLAEGGAAGGALAVAGVQVGFDAGAAEHVPALGQDAVLLPAVAHAAPQQLLLRVHLRGSRCPSQWMVRGSTKVACVQRHRWRRYCTVLRRLQQLPADSAHPADRPAAAQPACATSICRSPTADSRELYGVRGRGGGGGGRRVTSSRSPASALPLPSNFRSRSSLVCSTCGPQATHGLEAMRSTAPTAGTSAAPRDFFASWQTGYVRAVSCGRVSWW